MTSRSPAPAGALDWARDGADWPLREASAFVPAAGITWHVQRLGAGPAILLVHGTGAATHSWRALAPLLAVRHEVIAIDLPGHGFTGTPEPARLSLPGMAAALAELLHALGAAPALAVGHSAGAAVLARMALDRRIAPDTLFSLNGALLPLRGWAGRVFSPAARLFAATPVVPRWFARRAADPAVVRRLVDSTGSRIDERGVELYRRLVRSPAHAASALQMMANWELEPLARDLPRLPVPLVQIVGAADRTVRPEEADRVRRLLPAARIVTLPGLGHLAHEEAPERVAEAIEALAPGPRREDPAGR